MDRFDTAIAGWGLLPALLMVHLAHRAPHKRLLLLAADATVGGDQVEPVLPADLNPAARALVEPFSVAQWPGYFIAKDGSIEQFDQDVWLLDPVQVWLDLEDRSERCSCLTACGAVRERASAIEWAGGSASAERFIDLSALTELRTESEILGIEAVRQLGLPILADYDTAADGWEANQLLPLGDERVLVRKLPKRRGLIAANSSFASILNALVGD